MPKSRERLPRQIDFRQLALGAIGAVGLTGVFAIWAHVDPASLRVWCMEDGPLENGTAVMFGLAGVGFAVTMRRSSFLKAAGHPAAYIFTGCWVFLMIFFMGEEMSWGQRFLGIETPEAIARVNVQREFNVHNLALLHDLLGGGHRQLTIMMLTTGLLLPLFAVSSWGHRIVQATRFPVCPFAYTPFFVLAYLYGRFYVNILDYDAAEVREFLLGISMLVFAVHGVFRPDDLFRAPRAGDAVSASA